jgi:hypothetical protein
MPPFFLAELGRSSGQKCGRAPLMLSARGWLWVVLEDMAKTTPQFRNVLSLTPSRDGDFCQADGFGSCSCR